jgi:hypothetical protein
MMWNRVNASRARRHFVASCRCAKNPHISDEREHSPTVISDSRGRLCLIRSKCPVTLLEMRSDVRACFGSSVVISSCTRGARLPMLY